MTAILLFILGILGLNVIPQLSNKHYPKTEKAIMRLLFVTTGVCLILTILQLNGYKLKGLYSNPAVSVLFILISLLYFAIVQHTRRKFITVMILMHLILLNLFTLLFGRTICESEFGENHKIQVSTAGLMACGELMHVTKTKWMIFDKEIHYESSLCLREIKRIEVQTFNRETAEFLIYHNGEMDAENPYPYTIEKEKMW